MLLTIVSFAAIISTSQIRKSEIMINMQTNMDYLCQEAIVISSIKQELASEFAEGDRESNGVIWYQMNDEEMIYAEIYAPNYEMLNISYDSTSLKITDFASIRR